MDGIMYSFTFLFFTGGIKNNRHQYSPSNVLLACPLRKSK